MRFWRCYNLLDIITIFYYYDLNINKESMLWNIYGLKMYMVIFGKLEDHSFTKYYKRDNYIIPYSWETTKIGFNDYKRFYKFKEISESDAILEML